MTVPCPNCGEQVEQHSAPKRGPAMDGSEMWLCLKCPAIVCVWCYHVHTGEAHPDSYSEQPSKGSQKNKKHKRR